MPELPEVETIRRDLFAQILNKRIKLIEVFKPKTFRNSVNLKYCGEVINIRRTGKYLFLDIKKKCTLIIHLRMTGKLVYIKQDPLLESIGLNPKHISSIIHFDSNERLIFHDPRIFGYLEIVPFLEPFTQTGIDALAPDFTIDYLNHICSKRKVPVKNLLLDQKLIAGIGNIYAQEILFYAKINPLKLGKNLSAKELKLIHRYTLEILLLAINHNGTSISDFRRIDDKTGDFQNFLQVYQKQICPKCHQQLTRIKQSGRTTTYCANCQK